MDWIFLFIAGMFEIGFSSCLKLSDGFSRFGYSLGFLFFAIGSFFFLNLAIRTIPIGTAYAIWTGIGALGIAGLGMIFFEEPIAAPRLIFLGLLIGSIIGLKLVSA